MAGTGARPDLVISIDFGMTCKHGQKLIALTQLTHLVGTGVAYCNVATGSDTVRHIQRWPGRTQANENKVRSVCSNFTRHVLKQYRWQPYSSIRRTLRYHLHGVSLLRSRKKLAVRDTRPGNGSRPCLMRIFWNRCANVILLKHRKYTKSRSGTDLLPSYPSLGY